MNCVTCNHKNDPKDIIFENKNWVVVLIDDQAYIGCCVVILKNHKESLSELTSEEWIDFEKVVKKIEPAIKKAFNSPLLNWGCMMNHAFRDKCRPHVHWRVLARTQNPIIINKQKFFDPNFGLHYDIKHEQKVDKKTKKIIFDMIKKEIDN